uniref:Uncharacterized protein n=1 Tax=Glossina pallidipes TaxID=7398 RepID=A0A1A9ZTN1_GLOPL
MPEISQDAFEILNPGAPSETFNSLRSQKNPSTSGTANTAMMSSRDPQKDQKFSNGLARTDSLQPQGYKRELDHSLSLSDTTQQSAVRFQAHVDYTVRNSRLSVRHPPVERNTATVSYDNKHNLI